MSDPITLDRCPLDDLVFACTSDNDPLETEIAALASGGLSPDTFHWEEGSGRLASLEACPSGLVDLFAMEQERIAEQIQTIPVPELVRRLERLYDAAYTYDPATGTMDLSNPEMKRQLDLWIAAIDYQAYQDQEFLNRVKVPEIEQVLGLHSPFLSPADRGSLYRLRNGLSSFGEEYELGVRHTFEWLAAYDGTAPLFETPFWRSESELARIQVATYGQTALQAMARDAFPLEDVERLAGEAGLAADYARLAALSEEELLDRTLGVVGLIALRPSPQTMRGIAVELTLISLIFSSRGRDVESILREKMQIAFMGLGWTPEDAKLIAHNDAVNVTASRLDDYQGRFRLLRRFREIYTDFLQTPVAERFSPERSQRYNIWGRLILDQSLFGVPLSMEDLDRIRREAQSATPIRTDGPVSWPDLAVRGAKRPLWLRPSEIGLDADPAVDPLGYSRMIRVHGETLRDFIADNVDFIAVLPSDRVPSHALGVAYLLFGVVIMNGVYPEGDGAGRPWTPGSFLAVLGHEAGHNYYARANFDEHSERLSRLGVTERWSYLYEMGVIDEYAAVAPLDEGERTGLEDLFRISERRVAAANDRLDLSSGNYNLIFDDPGWQGRRIDFFAFQPGGLVRQDGTVAPSNQEVIASLPEEERDQLKQEYFDRELVRSGLSEEEQGVVADTLASLSALGEDAISPTFGFQHPLVRFLNHLASRTTGMLLTSFTTTGARWVEMEDDYLAAEVLRRRQEVELTSRWAEVAPDWAPFLQEAFVRLGLNDSERAAMEEAVSRLDASTFETFVRYESGHPLTRLILGEIPSMRNGYRTGLVISSRSQWLALKTLLLRSSNALPICRSSEP